MEGPTWEISDPFTSYDIQFSTAFCAREEARTVSPRADDLDLLAQFRREFLLRG